MNNEKNVLIQLFILSMINSWQLYAVRDIDEKKVLDGCDIDDMQIVANCKAGEVKKIQVYLDDSDTPYIKEIASTVQHKLTMSEYLMLQTIYFGKHLNKADNMKKNIFIFDVENTSLFGEAFAVGAIVVNEFGEQLDCFEIKSTEGEEKASDWVKENVCPSIITMPKCNYMLELRNRFYNFYKKHKDTCDIWCDCGFPVESAFLTAVANDDIKNREFDMPYPLYDLGTILDVNYERTIAPPRGLNPEEFPFLKHHPVNDCQASLRYVLLHRKNELTAFLRKEKEGVK